PLFRSNSTSTKTPAKDIRFSKGGQLCYRVPDLENHFVAHRLYVAWVGSSYCRHNHSRRAACCVEYDKEKGVRERAPKNSILSGCGRSLFSHCGLNLYDIVEAIRL